MTDRKKKGPKPRDKGLCLRQGCHNVADTRGLCRTDYSTAKKLVDEGKTTWQRLEALGKAAPSRRGTDRIAWFLDEQENPPPHNPEDTRVRLEVTP